MRHKLTVTLVAAFSLLLILCACGRKQSVEWNVSDTQAGEVSFPEANVGELFIYICGEVNVPGVYGFLDGARICDAISAAEGFTENAKKDYLNQAELLYDGEKIYVPSKAEEMNDPEAESSSRGISSDGKVNINFANQTELMSISGIGETRANAIIAYRDEHGDFSSLEDIMNVSGIGGSTYEKIKGLITIN